MNTILQRIVTARLFYDFCLFRGYRHNQTNPLPRGSLGYGDTPPKRGMIARQARLPWIPSDSEWEKLIMYLLQQESLRNQLMVLIAYDGALRREELVSLRVDDFDWATGHVTIRPETSKSGRQRTVIISHTTAALLKRYLWNERASILKVFGGGKQGPLFLSESNRNADAPITLGTFNDVVERVRAGVDLPWLAPHTFRHLRCTVLNRSPYLSDLSAEVLDRAGNKPHGLLPRQIKKITRALRQLHLLAPPETRSVAPPFREGHTEGIAPLWVAWCNAWLQRYPKPSGCLRAYYNLLLRVGRWLADRRPDIISPQQWDDELANEYLHYLCSTATAGDYTSREGLLFSSKRARQENL